MFLQGLSDWFPLDRGDRAAHSSFQNVSFTAARIVNRFTVANNRNLNDPLKHLNGGAANRFMNTEIKYTSFFLFFFFFLSCLNTYFWHPAFFIRKHRESGDSADVVQRGRRRWSTGEMSGVSFTTLYTDYIKYLWGICIYIAWINKCPWQLDKNDMNNNAVVAPVANVLHVGKVSVYFSHKKSYRQSSWRTSEGKPEHVFTES